MFFQGSLDIKLWPLFTLERETPKEVAQFFPMTFLVKVESSWKLLGSIGGEGGGGGGGVASNLGGTNGFDGAACGGDGDLDELEEDPMENILLLLCLSRRF